MLDGAKESFGDSPSPSMSEGVVKVQEQDLAGARASFQEALSRDPDFVPATRALAQLEAMMAQAPPEPGGDDK